MCDSSMGATRPTCVYMHVSYTCIHIYIYMIQYSHINLKPHTRTLPPFFGFFPFPLSTNRKKSNSNFIQISGALFNLNFTKLSLTNRKIYDSTFIQMSGAALVLLNFAVNVVQVCHKCTFVVYFFFEIYIYIYVYVYIYETSAAALVSRHVVGNVV